MSGSSFRGTSRTTRVRTRARAMLVVAGALGLGGILSVVASASAPAGAGAKASLAPGLYYLNDRTGSAYNFTVTNTGAYMGIGAVEVTAPSSAWSISACTSPPGWSAVMTTSKCRFRSSNSMYGIEPRGDTANFKVVAKTTAGNVNRVGTWALAASRNPGFDSPFAATATGPGLTSTQHTFELTGAVVTDGPVAAGSPCPAESKSAVVGASKTIVVCGRNRANLALQPTSQYSSLSGTFIKTKGAFLSGVIQANSGNVVLAMWNDTVVSDVFGDGKKVVTQVGSANNRTSPLRTFPGYDATSSPPVGVADEFASATEDTALVKNAADGVLANDTDAEGDSLTAVDATQPAHGALVLAADGSFTYTPNADYHGADSFTYKAYDGYTKSAPVTVSITVAPVNDNPVGVADATSVTEDATGTVPVLANDTDVDGDTLAVASVDTTGTLGTVTNNGTDVTYDPNGKFESLGAGQTATDTFSYTVGDGAGGTGSPVVVTVTITGDNDDPVAVGDAYSTDEATQIGPLAVLSNDSDDEGALSLTSIDTTGTKGAVTDNHDGTVTYNPNGAFEALGAGQSDTDSFTYTVTDTGGETTTATVTVTVNGINDAPVGVDDARTIAENAGDTSVTVLTNDTDAEGQTLSVSAVDTTGTTGTVTNHGTHVSYDPNGQFESLGETQTATDTFTYTVRDAQSGEDSAVVVTITIDGVNDSPDAVGDAASTTEAAGTGPISVLANDTDAEGAVTVTSVNTTGTEGTVTDNGDGTISYSPNGKFESLANGESDTDTFTYTITDAEGATDTATVTVTVNGINDAPVGVDDARTIGEDAGDTSVTVLANDTDAEGQTLTVSAVDTTGTTGTVTNHGTHVSYDPNGQFETLRGSQTATDTFTYTVRDAQSGEDANVVVTITIDGENDSPDAMNDATSTNENTGTGPISVLTNDSDTEGPLTVTSVNTTGTDGLVVDNGDGTISYSPNGKFEALANGQSDTDSFTYTVTDNDGATDTAVVTITVNGVNDAPAAIDDAANAGEGSTGATVSVLGNDTDAEGQTLTVTAVDTTGTVGTVTNNGSDVTYSPNGMFEYLDDTETATDTFTYTATDSQGGSDTATVTVTVAGANDAPVANDDGPFQTFTDQNIMLTTPGVLTNDTDADGEALTAGNASDPAHGTVALEPDGSFSYTPDSGYNGTDTFTYDVSDGTATDTATVTINVVSPNATPTAAATSGSGDEDSGAITVTLTGTDADGDSLTFAPGTATNGLVTVPGTVSCDANTPSLCTASVTYTPGTNFNGSDSFTYTVNDGTVDSAPATATITINPVNDAPSFTKGANQTVNEDAGAQTVNGWATAISSGPANESAQVVTFAVTNDNNGLFATQPAVDSAGNLTYTPATNANGTTTVTVVAEDDGGTARLGDDDSAPQTFTITVGAVNDAPSFTKGADQNVNEDSGAQSVSNWASAISKGPADESAQTVSFTASNDNNALFSVQPGVTATGTLVYTPAPNAVGSATVTISLSDTGGTANGGDDTSDAQTFTITVAPVNDAPSFTTAGNQGVLEDAGAQTVNGFVTGTSAGPADESAQTVTVAVVSNDNNGLFSAQPSITNGVLTYTPAADKNGSATVTVRATDDGGTANGGSNTSLSQQFTITVTAVNDAPSFTKGADQTLNEDAGAQSVSSWATAISDGPADESAQTVSFTVTNSDNGLFATQPAVSPTGTLTYTSAANKYGTATVSVAIVDNGGTANGGDDTSDVQTFTITVNPVNDAPVAATKSYTVQASMKISLGGLLTGATDPNDVAGDATWSPTFTVGSITAGAGCVGCTISNVNTAAGTFDFDPPAGSSGTFTVNYTVVDNGHPMPGATSAAQTITFTVTGPVIHFVDTTAGAGGTGRLSAPFNTLAAATTAMGTDANERIFVRGGNVSGNVTLPTDGWILSEAVTGASFDAVMGITPPAGTIARPAVNGTQRQLAGSVTVGTNSNVRGFDLTPPSGTAGLVGSGKTGLVVNQISATTTNARAVDLANSSGTFTFTRVSTTGAQRGISLVNTNVSTGSFTVTGSGTAGSGGTITGSTGAGTVASPEGGIHLNNTRAVSLDRMVVSNSTASGIFAKDVAGFTLANSSVTGNGTDVGLDHDGIRMVNVTGTVGISGTTVSGSKENNVRVINSSGTTTLTVSGSTFRDNDANLGANGILVNTQGTATMTFSSTGNTFTNNNTSGLALYAEASSPYTGTISGTNTFTGNMVGIDVASNGTGAGTFTVDGVSVTGCANCGAPINAYKATGATGSPMNVTVRNSTVNNANSGLAPGIWVHGEGAGGLRATVQNNNVRGVQHYGIYGGIGNGNGSLDMNVTGNDVDLTGTGAGALYGIFVENGTLPTDANVSCANIKTNRAIGGSGLEGISVYNFMNGSFRLPGFAGGNDTAAASYVASGNTATASAISNGQGFVGGAACATP